MARRKRKKSSAPHMDERWAVSYSDMMTVLMALFLVLYSMSTVDEKKYDQLRNSLQTGFGTEDTGKIDEIIQANPTPDEIKSDAELAMDETKQLLELRKKLNDKLAAKGLASDVEMEIGKEGLSIKLVSSETFFGPNNSHLSKRADLLLSTTAEVLKPSKYALRVEGHADYRAGTGSYETNWELSSDRAVKVLRSLTEKGGIPSSRVTAVGHGSSKPASKGKSAKDLAANRRTDIVVVSGQSDTVRALIADAQQK
jgi:chemotaxis protein MotB